MNANASSAAPLPGDDIHRPARLKACTIVVPGLNEEELIAVTVRELLEAARAVLDGVELILVDDGSTDRTGQIMEELAAENPEIVAVLHHDRPHGLAYAFRHGVGRARYPFFTLVPGDRAFEAVGIRRLLDAAGTADLVVSWRVNQRQARSTLRFVLNRAYKFVMGNLFQLRMTDVHSVNLYPVERVRRLDIQAEGVAFQIECLVKLLREGASWTEVPIELTPQKQALDRTVNLGTLRNLAATVLHLLTTRR